MAGANVAQILVKANTAQAQKSIKGLAKSLGGVKGAALAVGAAAGVAAVAGVAAFAKSSISAFAQAGDEVQKMSLRVGFSTEALSELKHAAELSGTSLGSLENGVKRMQRTILDAENGLSTAVDAFEMLGVEMADVEGKTPEEQFTLLSNALAGVEDASKRSALAQQVFGKAGTQLLPMLAAGKQGLADMRQEAHDLGLVFDQEAADSAAEYEDSLTRLKGAFQGIQFAIGKALVPALIPLINAFTKTAMVAGKVLGPALKTVGFLFNWIKTVIEIKIKAVIMYYKIWLLIGETLLDVAKKDPFLGAAIEKIGAILGTVAGIARAFSENWRSIFDEMIATVEGWANSIVAAVNELIAIIPEDIAERLGIRQLNEIELPRLKGQTEAAEVAISGLELASEELAATATAASKVIAEQVEELTEADARIAQMNATWAAFSTSVADNELAVLENIEAQFDQGHAYNALRDQIHKTIAAEEKLTDARKAEVQAAQDAADKIVAAAQRMQQEGNRQLGRAGVTNAYFDEQGVLQMLPEPVKEKIEENLDAVLTKFGSRGRPRNGTGHSFDRLVTGGVTVGDIRRYEEKHQISIAVQVEGGGYLISDEEAMGKVVADAINKAAVAQGAIITNEATGQVVN